MAPPSWKGSRPFPLRARSGRRQPSCGTSRGHRAPRPGGCSPARRRPGSRPSRTPARDGACRCCRAARGRCRGGCSWRARRITRASQSPPPAPGVEEVANLRFKGNALHGSAASRRAVTGRRDGRWDAHRDKRRDLGFPTRQTPTCASSVWRVAGSRTTSPPASPSSPSGWARPHRAWTPTWSANGSGVPAPPGPSTPPASAFSSSSPRSGWGSSPAPDSPRSAAGSPRCWGWPWLLQSTP